jgi:hypothetical protein
VTAKPVGLVANALQQTQCRRFPGQREPLEAIAREDQLLFLCQPDRHEPLETDLAQALVGRRELPFAAIDDHEVRKRTSVGQDALISPDDDLAHGREVVLHRALDLELPVLAFLIRPSTATTIEATVSRPCSVEISKQSIRLGRAGSASNTRSVSSASNADVAPAPKCD